MNLSSFLKRLLICSLTIYTPLFIISTYDYLFISNRTRKVFEIKKQRLLSEDIPQKLKAVNSGYKPLFFPNKLIKNETRPTFFPVGSLPFTNSYYCNEGYGLVTFKTDRFGLRNIDNKWKFANRNSNVFLIGDSYPFGECVQNNETIPFIINNLTSVNTLNLASDGNGPYEYMVTLNSIASPSIHNTNKENYIVMFFSDNDNIAINPRKVELMKSMQSIVEITSEKGIFPNTNYSNEIKKLIKDNYSLSKKELIKEIKDLKNKTNKTIKHSFLYQILTLVPIRSNAKNFITSLSISKADSPSDKAIGLLSKICKKQCKPIVVYIPSSSFWEKNSKSNIYKNKIYSRSKELGISFIDGEEIIDKDNIKDYAPKGHHLSKSGYVKIGNIVSDEIRNYHKNE